MGACATKPKVLGDRARRRSHRRRPSSNSYYANESSSSLKDEKGSISFSHYKDQDIINTPKDVQEVDTDIKEPDHYVHHDKLPSYDDDLDIHDPSIKDEAEQIRSAITKAIEQSKNDDVEQADSKEEEEISGPTPNNESQHYKDATIPAGLQHQNDFVQPETPAGNNDVVEIDTPARLHEADSSPPPRPTKNDVVMVEAVSPSKNNVEIESAMKTDGMTTSSLPHHASKDVMLVDPIGIGMSGSTYVAQDHHVIKDEDDVISTNIPSTFAF